MGPFLHIKTYVNFVLSNTDSVFIKEEIGVSGIYAVLSMVLCIDLYVFF